MSYIDSLFQVGEVHDHACFRVHRTPDSHLERVVVPVTVWIVTLPEDLAVRLVAEPSTVQSVAGTERLPPRKIHDGTWRHGLIGASREIWIF